MTYLVQSRLVNGPFSDPAVFLDFRYGHRALLFDCGDLSSLSTHEAMRTSHVFVSHTHIDHFCGFDQMLRLSLHRTAPLSLTGPAGFVDRIGAKLDAYTWNLLDETSPAFVMTVSEFDDDRISRRTEFHARRGFARHEIAVPDWPAGIAHREEDFVIEAAILDHGIPCLAFAFQERLRVNVLPNGLDALGLPVGTWLNHAKERIRHGGPRDERIAVDATRSVTIGELLDAAIETGPGQRIAYVVDAAPTAENREKIVALARKADLLYIEAAFADADAELATARNHLTTRLAGTYARAAGVERIEPFHFSARYLASEAEHRAEIEAAFRG